MFQKIERAYLNFFKPFEKKLGKHFTSALSFSIAIIICLAFFYPILSITSIPNFLSAFASSISLNLIGIASNLAQVNGIYTISFSGFQAQIIDLCSGKLEFALVIAAILSTFDRKISNRLKGIAFALITIFIFNVIRISISLYFVAHNQLPLSELFHDLIFRIFLVIAVAGIYSIWYLKLNRL